MDKSIGFIGLGRMGKNIILHLLEQGISVVGYNRTTSVTEEFVKELTQAKLSSNFTPASQLSYLISKLSTPRTILIMVKAGDPVDQVIHELLTAGLSKGDVVIDGGNSFFKDSIRRHRELQEKGISYIDCGTSGGLEGARNGACLMLGGDKEIVESYSWLWDAISGSKNPEKGKDGNVAKKEGGVPPKSKRSGDEGGWTYFGPSGAGHFVKMVHNGVEYGIDQAIGDGFALLEEAPYDLDLAKVAENWTKGSVVRGWLMELLARALSKEPHLESYKGIVGGGETGNWTIATARERNVPQPMLAKALEERAASQSHPTFATKVVSALRFEYGRHKEVSSTK